MIIEKESDWLKIGCSVVVSDLFGVVELLLCGCRGEDGPVAARAELQAEREATDQLQPQLCDADPLLQHTHRTLRQD